MKLKTLKIELSEEEIGGEVFGTRQLFYDGSKRIILTYLLFSKNINGEKRRGFQFIEQTASTGIACSVEGVATYNTWENKRFVNPSFLEEKFNF